MLAGRGLEIRRSDVARTFHALNVSPRSTASRAGVIESEVQPQHSDREYLQVLGFELRPGLPQLLCSLS